MHSNEHCRWQVVNGNKENSIEAKEILKLTKKERTEREREKIKRKTQRHIQKKTVFQSERERLGGIDHETKIQTTRLT